MSALSLRMLSILSRTSYLCAVKGLKVQQAGTDQAFNRFHEFAAMQIVLVWGVFLGVLFLISCLVWSSCKFRLRDLVVWLIVAFFALGMSDSMNTRFHHQLLLGLGCLTALLNIGWHVICRTRRDLAIRRMSCDSCVEDKARSPVSPETGTLD